MSHPERINLQTAPDWIQNNTGSCPGMLIGKMVRYEFRCGRVSLRPYVAETFNWKRRGYDFDVKAALPVEEEE